MPSMDSIPAAGSATEILLKNSYVRCACLASVSACAVRPGMGR